MHGTWQLEKAWELRLSGARIPEIQKSTYVQRPTLKAWFSFATRGEESERFLAQKGLTKDSAPAMRTGRIPAGPPAHTGASQNIGQPPLPRPSLAKALAGNLEPLGG